MNVLKDIDALEQHMASVNNHFNHMNIRIRGMKYGPKRKELIETVDAPTLDDLNKQENYIPFSKTPVVYIADKSDVRKYTKSEGYFDAYTKLGMTKIMNIFPDMIESQDIAEDMNNIRKATLSDMSSNIEEGGVAHLASSANTTPASTMIMLDGLKAVIENGLIDVNTSGFHDAVERYGVSLQNLMKEDHLPPTFFHTLAEYLDPKQSELLRQHILEFLEENEHKFRVLKSLKNKQFYEYIDPASQRPTFICVSAAQIVVRQPLDSVGECLEARYYVKESFDVVKASETEIERKDYMGDYKNSLAMGYRVHFRLSRGNPKTGMGLIYDSETQSSSTSVIKVDELLHQVAN